jgi:hypothetical protein
LIGEALRPDDPRRYVAGLLQARNGFERHGRNSTIAVDSPLKVPPPSA